jgi:hypothetical protein
MNPYDTIIARYYQLFNSKTPLLIAEEAEFRDICTTLLGILLQQNKDALVRLKNR